MSRYNIISKLAKLQFKLIVPIFTDAVPQKKKPSKTILISKN